MIPGAVSTALITKTTNKKIHILSDNYEQTVDLITRLDTVLQQKGINLTKYRFQKTENTPIAINNKEVKLIDCNEISILGVKYNPKTDTFVFRIPEWDANTKVTKENIYS